jgi:hypothetical protein
MLHRTAVAIAVVVLAFSAFSLGTVSLNAEVQSARFLGQPQFDDGEAFGYFVWLDGDTWKVRWTTFGANHLFGGSVVVEGGEFRSFKRIDVDTERKVLAPGRPGRVVRGPRGRIVGVGPGRAPVVAERVEDRIEQETEHLLRFRTRTDDDIDGFDFKLTDGATILRFVLEIDGVRRPAEIEIGKANFKPNEDPLVVRLR